MILKIVPNPPHLPILPLALGPTERIPPINIILIRDIPIRPLPIIPLDLVGDDAAVEQAEVDVAVEVGGPALFGDGLEGAELGAVAPVHELVEELAVYG
jgi:hypothetical protein